MVNKKTIEPYIENLAEKEASATSICEFFKGF